MTAPAGLTQEERTTRVSSGRAGRFASVGLLPFLAYSFLFLGLPTIAIGVGAFESPNGGFTLHNVSLASGGVYRHGFLVSLELALLSSIIPGLLGFVIAYAIHRGPEDSRLRQAMVTASGVFANFGGVPLAFLFIATLGTTGLATGWFKSLGFDPYAHGFNLYALGGVLLVYLYFQLPLMVLVMLPALAALKDNWWEAASGLGASRFHYWRHVAGPVLLPAFLGSVLLLFGSGLSAYATAEALTSGSIPLTSIQIGSFLNGNVLAGQENVGKALGLGMVLIVAVAMFAYARLQRRSSRWLER